jgi:hypothetical protein
MEKHPLLGVQLFTLGDLALMCGDKDVARLVYQWCYEVRDGYNALKLIPGNKAKFISDVVCISYSK